MKIPTKKEVKDIVWSFHALKAYELNTFSEFLGIIEVQCMNNWSILFKRASRYAEFPMVLTRLS